MAWWCDVLDRTTSPAMSRGVQSHGIPPSRTSKTRLGRHRFIYNTTSITRTLHARQVCKPGADKKAQDLGDTSTAMEVRRSLETASAPAAGRSISIPAQVRSDHQAMLCPGKFADEMQTTDSLRVSVSCLTLFSPLILQAEAMNCSRLIARSVHLPVTSPPAASYMACQE